MSNKTNPASRLYKFLVLMRNASSVDRTIREVLRIAFQIGDSNDIVLYQKLLLLLRLLDRTEDVIRGLENLDHNVLLRHFPKIRKGLLSAPLDTNSKQAVAFRDAFDPTCLQAIEFCAQVIPARYRETPLERDDLDSLFQSLTDLSNFTLEANLDPQLRDLSLEIIQILRKALSDYSIHGADGLEASLEQSLGKLNLYYQRTKTDNDPSILKQIEQIFDRLIRLDTVISKAKSLTPILAELAQRLLGA